MPYDAMQSDAKSVKVKESHTRNLVFLRQFLAMTPGLFLFFGSGHCRVLVVCCGVEERNMTESFFGNLENCNQGF